MKPLIFCRKCLVVSICQKKCEYISKIKHIIDITILALLFIMAISWAIGFAIMLVTDNSSTMPMIPFISILIIIGAIVSVMLIARVGNKITSRFG